MKFTVNKSRAAGAIWLFFLQIVVDTNVIQCYSLYKGGAKMLSIKEFAAELQVHHVTVRRWIRQGMPVIRIGGIVRIEKDKAYGWMNTKGKGG